MNNQILSHIKKEQFHMGLLFLYDVIQKVFEFSRKNQTLSDCLNKKEVYL